MGKCIAEGIRKLNNVGLDGMPTANQLVAFLCDKAEADINHLSDTITSTLIAKTIATSVIAKAGLTVDANRDLIINSIQFLESGGGTSKSFVIADKDPGVAGAVAIAVQDLNGGAVWPNASGPPLITSLTIRDANDGE